MNIADIKIGQLVKFTAEGAEADYWEVLAIETGTGTGRKVTLSGPGAHESLTHALPSELEPYTAAQDDAEAAEADIEAQIKALEEWQGFIMGPHRTAFRTPKLPASDYRPGDAVWMWDHYNTGLVKEVRDGRVCVTTWAADGREMYLEYQQPGQIRPALSACVFIWPQAGKFFWTQTGG